MAEISLTYRPWKKNLDISPKESELSLVSLYDLLYDEDGVLWAERALMGGDGNATVDSKIGTKLGHDIICFNEAMVTKTGEVDTSVMLESSLFANYGLDISIAEYDPRAKHRTVRCERYLEIGDGIKIFKNESYTIYDKEAAVAPKFLSIFNRNTVFLDNDGVTPSWDNMVPPKIGPLDGLFTSYSEMKARDIYLANKDTIFNSTLATQDNFSAYRSIFLSPNSDYTKLLLMKALKLNEFTIFSSYGGKLKKERPADVNQVLDLTKIDSVTIPKAINNEGDDLWFKILKNTFVWVRATFYADYIKQESFAQDLNQDSKVKHKELMVSGAGSFKKYDKWLYANATLLEKLNEDGRSEQSVPYLPRTSPTVDFYTSEYLRENLPGIVADDKDGNYSSALTSKYIDGQSNYISNWLDTDVSGNDMSVGGLPVPNLNRFNADILSQDDQAFDNIDEMVFPSYFDTESRKVDNDYRKMSKFPTIIPSSGNAYIDGRIISPTIDEIWYMIKKLVGGRLSDVQEVEGSLSNTNQRSQDLDIAVPYGNSNSNKNDTNTTMTEVPESEYNFSYGEDEDIQYNKRGDPVGWELSSQKTADGVNKTKLSITKFINQNDSIVYPIYGNLKSLSQQITKFALDNSNINREIDKFTAWNSIVRPSSNDNVILDGQVVTAGISDIWSPRRVPYSIRELEALMMGNKFNLLTLARFLKESFAVTGGLGKETINKYTTIGGENYIDYDEELKNLSGHIFSQRTTDPKKLSNKHANEAAGSLYQMHKNYNFKVDEPNTWYNRYGTDDGRDDTGTRAIYRDMDRRNIDETHISKFNKTETTDYKIINDSGIERGHYSRDLRLGRFTKEKYTIRLREDYGTDPSLDENQDVIAAENVYLAADGTWRHIADHNRVPVLRCRF